MTDAPEYWSTFGLRRLGLDFVKDALERILEWKGILGMWGKWRICLLLQFISSTMVPFSFLSYITLIYSLVCSHTIGYILWFSWALWTLLLSNSNPCRSRSTTTGWDDTCWLICAYAYHGQPRLLSDSFVLDTYSLLLIDSFLFYRVLRLRVP